MNGGIYRKQLGAAFRLPPRHPFFTLVLVFSFAWWGWSLAVAEEPAKPESKPAVYDNAAALQARLEKISQSDFAELSSLGKTLGGRDVWLLTLGAKLSAAKPAVLLVGSVQASDLAAGELTLQMAERLLADATSNDEAAKKQAEQLLKQYTFYLIPRPSPDASERCFAELKTDSVVNQRTTDDDRDGETDEDPTDDLDANGLITMMRVESRSGNWILHPEDPRVMIEADPKKNELGQYLLYTEGIDNDGDGRWNEDRPGGIDFNRNFTFQYPYFEPVAGPNQVSEPETRAVADFAFNHANIALVYSFGPHDNINHPWKPNGNSDGSQYKTAILSADAPFQDKLVETIKQTLDLKDAPPSAGDDGAFAPWAYFHYGRWSLATRPWWVPAVSRENLAKALTERSKEKPAAEKPAEEKPGEAAKPPAESRGSEQLNALRWLELEQIAGFVPWKTVEHPDFPGLKVEVGGFVPNVLLNPPIRMLDGLAEKHLKGLAKALELSPSLMLSSPKCEALGGGVYRLKVTVRNQGFLPTMAAQGKASQLVAGVQIEATLPKDVKLITGTPRKHLPVLAGKTGSTEVSWILQAKSGTEGQIKLKAWSPTIGGVEEQVAIPKGK